MRREEINIPALNDMLFQIGSRRLVERSEQRYRKEIQRVALEIDAQKKTRKIILIAGPSSSGKTTTAHLLCRYLEGMGVNSVSISLDDFFLSAEQTPRLPDGKPDFESVNALDIPRIHQSFAQLLEKGKTTIPIFDFKQGRPGGERELAITNHVVLVEGIHALNPILIPEGMGQRIYRLYISTSSEYERGGHILLTARDVRLCRRMLRDVRHRNASIRKTLDMWGSVADGERKYIAPFHSQANDVIDSVHWYEPMVYRELLLPLLPKDGGSRQRKLDQIREALSLFEPLPLEVVPENSMLNEFVR